MKKTPTPSQNTETRELQERCTRLERALNAVLAAVGVELRIEDLEDVAAPRASDGTGLLEDGDLPVPRRRPQVDPDVAAALRREEKTAEPAKGVGHEPFDPTPDLPRELTR